MATDTAERFTLHFDELLHRRRIAGQEVILHCHHYNSRIQRTIEFADAIDGKKLIIDTAESVFARHLSEALRETDDVATRWEVATSLYAHLGYGMLDFSAIDDGVVVAPSSHFVEGWRAGFPNCERPVCSLATGYIQAAAFAAAGELVDVTEEHCALHGGEACEFRVTRGRTRPVEDLVRRSSASEEAIGVDDFLRSPNVDSRAILEALVAMPVHGDERGLIPAFNVYLASTPADFYNLVCLRFLHKMTEVGLGSLAREQLIYDAETCGMNTFRGIMASTEWEALVAPMIREERDTIFAIVAVSNALGWGNWDVRRYDGEEQLELVSRNGYEASGALEWHGGTMEPLCLMLTGASAGIMQLVHGIGTLEERFGQFTTIESSCRAAGDACCSFEVEATP